MNDDISQEASNTLEKMQKEKKVSKKLEVLNQLLVYVDSEYEKIDFKKKPMDKKTTAKAWELAVFSQGLGLLMGRTFSKEECEDIKDEITSQFFPRQESFPTLKETSEEILWVYKYLADICNNNDFIPKK